MDLNCTVQFKIKTSEEKIIALLLSMSMAMCIMSVQNWATSLAPSDASISACNEQLTGHPGHDIKCPIVCGHHLPALIPFYLWSAQHVTFFHSPLFTVMASSTPFSNISFVTQSIHLFFGLSLLLHLSTFIPITLLVTCVSSLLIRVCGHRYENPIFIYLNGWDYLVWFKRYLPKYFHKKIGYLYLSKDSSQHLKVRE